MKSNSGNWISLDFRGILIKSYFIFLSIHILLSTLAVFYIKANIYSIHLISFILSVVIILTGLFIYDKSGQNKLRNEFKIKRERSILLSDDVQLKSWYYIPDEKNPKQIHAEIFVKSSGRFSASARIMDDAGNTVFSSGTDSQIVVKNGQNLQYLFSLNRISFDTISNVELTFYLFKGPVGESTKDDVSKIFMKSPLKKYDGSYIYEELPAPLNPKRE